MRYIQQNGILVPLTSRNRQRGFITCGPAFFGGAAVPSTTFAQYITALSPVAWWRMDDAVGSSYLNDTIANEHATLAGTYTLGSPGLVTGDSDTAVLWNNGSAATTAGSKWALGTGDVSALLVVKYTYTTQACLFTVRSSSGSGILLYVDINSTNGSIRTLAQDGTTHGVAAGDKNYADGNVHVIGVTQDVSTKTLTLYIDGASKGSVTLTNARPSGSGMNVNISQNIGGIQRMTGTTDELVLFDTLLDTGQMTNVSNLVHNGHL